MGSYAQCWLDDLFVGSSKNDIDPDLISLFRPEDKVSTRHIEAVHPALIDQYAEALADDEDLCVVYYETTVDHAEDRLKVLGYSLETAKDAFSAWISGEICACADRSERLQISDPDFRDLMLESYQKDQDILKSLSPENWINWLNEIRDRGLTSNYHGRHEGPYKDTAIGYMLRNEWHGYPGYDMFVPLRLAMEAFEKSETLIYDVSDLVWSGYFDKDDDFIRYGIQTSEEEYSERSKIIVLTEGKTDAWILDESMKLLYPHLRNYYSFLDFESSGFGGAVGNLANAVKAFAGAGIVNNVIALFDNDTAAFVASRNLTTIALGRNIEIKHLPDLESLRSYPTIGPSGFVNLDINGVAASIELYMGSDILKAGQNDRCPVQWTGYDRSIGRYQGEVLDKPSLHARFREKLTQSTANLLGDWDGMRAICEVLFTAFAERNRASISKRAKAYYAR